jgi:dUTP pyrophosphatase
MNNTHRKVIRVKRLPHGEGLPCPRRMTEGSSGSDVAAAVAEDTLVQPGGRILVPTGLCLEIPAGYEVQVRPRSGLAARHGVTVLNSPGTIDSDYRGEVKVILVNLGDKPFVIRRGERIAQLGPMRIPLDLGFLEVGEVNNTRRGTGGFGHSGVR